MNKAVKYCTLGLQRQERHPRRFIAAKILYRRAQAYQFLHRFKSSEADLVMAKSILADLGCITTSVGQEKSSDNQAAMEDLILKVDRFTSFIEFKQRQFGDIDEAI